MVEESDARQVLVTHSGAVATVTLNRPEHSNGLTTAVKEQLRDALRRLAEDSRVRSVVLTGSGRAFCVGQDLGEHAEALHRDANSAFDTVEEHYNPIVTALATMPKPVIAAVNGTCVGAGLGFALACDIRIAAETAKFGTAFTAIGLTCDSGLSASLAQAVGTSRATELMLLGERFGADQASQWGVVGRVVPSAELPEAAATLAHRLANGPTSAYAEAKLAMAAARQPALAEILAAEGAAQKRLGLTYDHRTAVTAFLTKEQPAFTGT